MVELCPQNGLLQVLSNPVRRSVQCAFVHRSTPAELRLQVSQSSACDMIEYSLRVISPAMREDGMAV